MRTNVIVGLGVILSAAFFSSDAQARVVYFSGVAESNLRADAGAHSTLTGGGLIGGIGGSCTCVGTIAAGSCTCSTSLRCSVMVTNISLQPQSVSWTLRYGALEPSNTTTGINNPWPAGQTHTHNSVAGGSWWHINSQAAAHTNVLNAPAPPVTLAPFGTGNDSVRFWAVYGLTYRFNRGSIPLTGASPPHPHAIPTGMGGELQGLPTFAQPAPPAIPYPLQYFPDFFFGATEAGLMTYTGSIVMPEHIKATQICAGAITVNDVPGNPSGVVIASGEMDYIADSAQNPNFQTGTRMRQQDGLGPHCPNPDANGTAGWCDIIPLPIGDQTHTWGGGSQTMRVPGTHVGRVDPRSTLDTHNVWQSSVANIPLMINGGKPF